MAYSDKYQYFEYEFDGRDAVLSFKDGCAASDWPAFNIARPIDNIAAMKILEVQVPNTFYQFTAENNMFGFYEETILGAFTSAVVTIPEGNYDCAMFVLVLQELLNEQSATMGNGNAYVVSYSCRTGKLLTIKTTNIDRIFQFQFGFTGDRGVTNPRLLLGFNAGTVQSSFAVGYQRILAPNVLNLSGPDYLYLNSNALGPLINLFLPDRAIVTSNGGLGPQIARIPVTTNSGEVIYWSDPDPDKWFDVDGLHLFPAVDFYFTLGNLSTQTPLRFNGSAFSIKLGILAGGSDSTTIHSEGALMKKIRLFR